MPGKYFFNRKMGVNLKNRLRRREMKSVKSCLDILTWQVYIQNKAGKITFKSLEIGFVKIVFLNVITLFTFLLVTTIEGKRVEREIYNF